MLRRYLAPLAVLVALALPALPARSGVVNGIVTATPLSGTFCTLASLGSATDLSGCAAHASATCVYVTATGANVNWRDDGTPTAPVGSGGQQLAANSSMWYCGSLAALKFIQQSASATVAVSFYR